MNLYSKLLLPYENQWIALTMKRDRVLEYAKTIEGLERKLKKFKEKKIILTKVLPFDRDFSPNVYYSF